MEKPGLERQTNSKIDIFSNPKKCKINGMIMCLCRTLFVTAKVSKRKRVRRPGLDSAAPLKMSFQICSPHLLMAFCLLISLKASRVFVFCKSPLQRIPLLPISDT